MQQVGRAGTSRVRKEVANLQRPNRTARSVNVFDEDGSEEDCEVECICVYSTPSGYSRLVTADDPSDSSRWALLVNYRLPDGRKYVPTLSCYGWISFMTTINKLTLLVIL
uniref:Putative til domain protein n=1 Tax=Ixodes ricinus TaxID=34613 RepID=A0A0K8RLP9_IXORI